MSLPLSGMAGDFEQPEPGSEVFTLSHLRRHEAGHVGLHGGSLDSKDLLLRQRVETYTRAIIVLMQSLSNSGVEARPKCVETGLSESGLARAA